MKELKFVPQLIPLILSGEKTSTWRLFDEKDLQVGDTVAFIDRSTGQRFATAKLVLVSKKTLGHVNKEDYEGHEKFVTKQEMLKTYQSYYSDQVVDENTEVKIIQFDLQNV